MARTLRPYQAAAVEAAQKALDASNSTIIVLPTGCGKTVVASKIIGEWDRGNCLFLAHTKELIQQAAARLEPDLGYRPGVEMGLAAVDKGGLWQGGLCVVGSVQSMYGDKRLDKYRNHPFGLIVVDEAHRALGAMYLKVIDYFRALNPRLKVLGITATPNRGDGAALGLAFESVAYEMSTLDAIEGGWLCPIAQEYVVVEELTLDAVGTRKNDQGESDFAQAQLEKVMIQEEMLHRLAVPTVEKVGDRPTLVFTASVAHAHAMAAVLNRYKPGAAAAVDGTTDAARREEAVRDFAQGKLQFLCNCSVFVEGFDAPNCSAVVMARPTKSLSAYTQMLGRGLRPLPGVVDGIADAQDRRLAILTSAKPSCLVLDFVGNSKHKLASSYDVLGGNYDVEVRELAQQAARAEQKDVGAALSQAAALLALERQMKEREAIKARDIKYGSHSVNPFDRMAADVVGSMYVGATRGTATESQVRLLVNLGVSEDVALRYSKEQAGAVIDSIGSKHCTTKQAGVLKRAGIDPAGIGFERASRIIDALAKNGWKRPAQLPE